MPFIPTIASGGSPSAVTTWGLPAPQRVGWTGFKVERFVLLVICWRSKPAAVMGGCASCPASTQTAWRSVVLRVKETFSLMPSPCGPFPSVLPIMEPWMAYAVMGRLPWVWLRRVGDTPPCSTLRESPPWSFSISTASFGAKRYWSFPVARVPLFSIWSRGPLPPPSQPQRIRMETAGCAAPTPSGISITPLRPVDIPQFVPSVAATWPVSWAL